MSEWKTIKFSDFITLQRGFDLTKNQIVDGEYPVVCSTSIMGYHNAYKCMGPGVVTGRSGTIGQVQYIEGNYWPHNTSLYVKDFKGNDVKFVYYFLMHFNPAKAQTGAAVPTLNRNNLGILDVTIPDLATQRRISSILSQYDSLIENCRCQIKLLEEAAQRTYREWFVEMRFPGHENVRMEDGLPEGWRRGILADVVYESGKNEKKERRNNYEYYLPIDCMPKKSLAYVDVNDVELAESSLLSFEENDILFGAMRPYFHKVVVARDKGLTRSTCFVLNSTKDEYWSYVVMLLFDKDSVDYATQISVGTTMPYVRWNDFKNMPIVIPKESTMEKFNDIIKPIVNKDKTLAKQIRFLQQSRDLMLPRLMRGEEC